MKLTEKEVKGFFIACQNTAKDGIYHGEGHDALDLMEFADKIAEYITTHVSAQSKQEEHKRCVEIVSQVNKDVANYLEDKRQYAK